MEPNELITQLYVGYYNRAPDPEGLNYWMGRLAAGVSLADIAESFATSPEAISTYPWLAVEEPTEGQVGAFLEAIYQNMFNRSIDADGLAYYSNQLLTGERTAGEIIASIQANANTNTNNTDGQILANKVEVGLAWATAAAAQPGFTYNAEAAASANSILDGVGATQASVDAALGIVEDFFDAPASLEGALEALAAAREAVAAQDAEIADFLADAYSNEFVEAATTTDTNTDGDIDAGDVTSVEINAAHTATTTTLLGASDGSISGSAADFIALTDAAQDARIATARTDLNAAITAAEDAAETAAEALEDGVAPLVATAQEAADALEVAIDAQDEQNAATGNVLTAAGAVASDSTGNNDVTFVTTSTAGVVEAAEATAGNEAITEINNGAVRFSSAVALNAAGTAYVITLDSGETSTISKTFLDQVLAAAQADYAADAAVTAAENDLAAAVVDVLETSDPSYAGPTTYAGLSGTVINVTNTAGTDAAVTLDYSTSSDGADLNAYASALATVATEEADLAEFEDALADWLGTEALVDQLGSLNEERTELVNAANRAEAQIENDENGDPAGLGISLLEGADNFTVEDDVYLFAEGANQSLTGFGTGGEDSIYFGAGYSLVALGDNGIGDNVGSVSELEIFWEEVGGNLVLYVENETFAGNGSTTGDITTITLNGVSADEVALVGGFLVEAEAAVA